MVREGRVFCIVNDGPFARFFAVGSSGGLEVASMLCRLSDSCESSTAGREGAMDSAGGDGGDDVARGGAKGVSGGAVFDGGVSGVGSRGGSDGGWPRVRLRRSTRPFFLSLDHPDRPLFLHMSLSDGTVILSKSTPEADMLWLQCSSSGGAVVGKGADR